MIYHKFVLILKFKYILFTMQPRLQRSRTGSPFIKVIAKLLLVLLLIFLAFFFVEKIDFPSPQKEIIEDVTDKAIKLR